MEMLKVSVCVFFVVFFVNIAQSTNQMRKKEWEKHAARVGNFKCQTPQPRNIHIKEFIDETVINSARRIVPDSTVLHRCGSSGCCTANRTCTAVQVEKVKLVFFVIRGKLTDYIEVTAKNHTSCACHYHANNPK